MSQPTQHHSETETLHTALMLACKRIADSSQKFEEANTAEGWAEEFIRQAEEPSQPTAIKM